MDEQNQTPRSLWVIRISVRGDKPIEIEKWLIQTWHTGVKNE